MLRVGLGGLAWGTWLVDRWLVDVAGRIVLVWQRWCYTKLAYDARKRDL